MTNTETTQCSKPVFGPVTGVTLPLMSSPHSATCPLLSCAKPTATPYGWPETNP